MEYNLVLPWHHRVCGKCLKRNKYAVWLIKYGCFQKPSAHRGAAVVVVVDHRTMSLTEVRHLPAIYNHFHGRFHMCRRYVNNCYNGDQCTFAHSQLELDNWNTLKTVKEAYPTLYTELTTYQIATQSPSTVCEQCFVANSRAVWLSWLTCTDKSHGVDRVKVVLSRDRNRLVQVQDPGGGNPSKLNPSQLKICEHQNDCASLRNCTLPHSEEELIYWRWKVATEKMRSLLSKFMFGDSNFGQLCERYSYPAEHLDVMRLDCHQTLTCDNYREKYHKLVYMDNLEHARKMVVDCDGEVTIDNSDKYGYLNKNEVHVVT